MVAWVSPKVNAVVFGGMLPGGCYGVTGVCYVLWVVATVFFVVAGVFLVVSSVVAVAIGWLVGSVYSVCQCVFLSNPIQSRSSNAFCCMMYVLGQIALDL